MEKTVIEEGQKPRIKYPGEILKLLDVTTQEEARAKLKEEKRNDWRKLARDSVAISLDPPVTTGSKRRPSGVVMIGDQEVSVSIPVEEQARGVVDGVGEGLKLLADRYGIDLKPFARGILGKESGA